MTMMKKLALLTMVCAIALMSAQSWANCGACGGGDSSAGSNKEATTEKHEHKSDTADKAACSAEKAASCTAEKAAACTAEKSASCPADKKEAGACCAGKDKPGACCAGKDTKNAKAENAMATVPGGADKASDVKAYGVGSKVSDISLPEAKSGTDAKLSALAGEKATVLVFWNQNCPYVKEAQDRVAKFHEEYSAKGVKVVAIDAGVDKPAEDIKTYAGTKSFPILINSDSKVAAQFGAAHTPEVFMLDKDMNVIYHGAFDSGKSKTEDGKVKTYVQDVAEAVIAGKEHIKETKAFGCSVKYAEGVKPM
jgi:thiol-disulfide isomerase/thioredoxin